MVVEGGEPLGPRSGHSSASTEGSASGGSRRAVWGRGFRAVALVLVCLGASGVGGETIDWICNPDGSLNAADMETKSCAYSEISTGRPCLSCTVSIQEGEAFSGLLVPKEEFRCMESVFELVQDQGAAQQLLCPGRYKVRGCEANEGVFNQRVLKIRTIIDDARTDLDSCFDDLGYRKFETRCNQGFPKMVKVELAARLEFDSNLVKDRNPATYTHRTINTCTELIDLLSQTLVGCVVDSALGLVSPVSSEVYCQSISWRPAGDEYHPPNALLPKAVTTTETVDGKTDAATARRAAR